MWDAVSFVVPTLAGVLALSVVILYGATIARRLRVAGPALFTVAMACLAFEHVLRAAGRVPALHESGVLALIGWFLFLVGTFRLWRDVVRRALATGVAPSGGE